MKPSDICGIVIRLTGVFLSIWGLWNIVAGVQFVFSALFQSGSPSPFAYLFYGVPAVLLGLLFFFFADWLVSLSYRKG
jgi:hypothetical protein